MIIFCTKVNQTSQNVGLDKHLKILPVYIWVVIATLIYSKLERYEDICTQSCYIILDSQCDV